jgi:hypothetical protein
MMLGTMPARADFASVLSFASVVMDVSCDLVVMVSPGGNFDLTVNLVSLSPISCLACIHQSHPQAPDGNED